MGDSNSMTSENRLYSSFFVRSYGISCILYRSKLPRTWRLQVSSKWEALPKLTSGRSTITPLGESMMIFRLWEMAWWQERLRLFFFSMLLTFHNISLSLTMRRWCFYQSFSVSCSQFTIFVETRDPLNRAIRTRPCTSSPKTRDPLLLSLFSFFPRKIGSHCDVSVVVWLRIL